MKKGVAIGTFDGLHKGHFKVLSSLKSLCEMRGYRPVVMTFDRHPLTVVDPSRAPGIILSPEEKKNLLEREGIEVEILEFNDEIRNTTAEEWLRKLHDENEVELLVLGYDNRFGKDGRSLSIIDYKRLGKAAGIDIVTEDELEGVSSTLVRRALSEGDVEQAEEMLGRPYRLKGKVVSGEALGRSIGYPTANVRPEKGMIVPGNGVYAAIAQLHDGTRINAMVNIGERPTVASQHDHHRVIEAHLIDWKGDLYGEKISLDFLKRLRDEKRFDNIAELQDQLGKDKKEVLEIIANTKRYGMRGY